MKNPLHSRNKFFSDKEKSKFSQKVTFLFPKFIIINLEWQIYGLTQPPKKLGK